MIDNFKRGWRALFEGHPFNPTMSDEWQEGYRCARGQVRFMLRYDEMCRRSLFKGEPFSDDELRSLAHIIPDDTAA
jgi:hypothetical protein